MKKVLVLLLCITFLMSSFVSFAEVEQAASQEQQTVSAAEAVTLTAAQVTDTTSTEQLVQTAVYEEEVSEAEVDALVKIDGLDSILTEQESIVSSIYNADEINAENLVVVLTAIKKYLTVRDNYYKAVLLKLRVISQTQNKALARKAIVRFEQMYNNQKEMDKKIHHKIEKVLKYIKNHGKKLSKQQKAAIRAELQPLLKKYFRHRQLIIHIHNMIKKLKLALYKEHVMQLRQFAAQLEKAKKYNAALRVYEEALKNGDADKEVYKKIGEINKKTGKKGPGIYVGKKRVNAQVDPVVKNGTTLVPLRAVSESLDANVKWDAKLKKITIIKGDKIIELTLKSKIIKINGEQKTIEQPADVISGNTVVPLRVVSETLDATVGYDNETKLVTVEDNFSADAGTMSAEQAAETGVVSSSEVAENITGEQAAEQLLNGTQE